jgi:hypothetical protein
LSTRPPAQKTAGLIEKEALAMQFQMMFEKCLNLDLRSASLRAVGAASRKLADQLKKMTEQSDTTYPQS